ncbi:hypothetical protein KQX54_012272 [Cotesia glomerata]|uniref:Uncharacterized protein n=1 Tax=Cotesia glomerata TaxID=32391 RepID=A0AAV7HWT7_COTGL|nr:hypothetical protein KQX54_012272 [Cotesia glomerata]
MNGGKMERVIKKCFIPSSCLSFWSSIQILDLINQAVRDILYPNMDGNNIVIKKENIFDHIFTIGDYPTFLTKTSSDFWWFKICINIPDGAENSLPYSFIDEDSAAQEEESFAPSEADDEV